MTHVEGSRAADRPTPARRIPEPRRVTISDIAKQVGVTTSAVSLAVNGKRGVSDATRARVLAVADSLGWRPHHGARTLNSTSSGAVGLALMHPPSTTGDEAFFTRFLAGVQSCLRRYGLGLLIYLAENMAEATEVHQAWIAERRVDGFLMMDSRSNDPRLAAVIAARIPTVVVGGEVEHPPLVSVRVDEAGVMDLALEYLQGLGHSRVALVTGDGSFVHARRRMEAFELQSAVRGMEPTGVPDVHDVHTVRDVTTLLLEQTRRPTAVIFDTDLFALAAVREAESRGIRIPEDLSILAWEDSAFNALSRPAITAINRDAMVLGQHAATALLRSMGRDVDDAAPFTAAVIARESTGYVPA